MLADMKNYLHVGFILIKLFPRVFFFFLAILRGQSERGAHRCLSFEDLATKPQTTVPNQ